MKIVWILIITTSHGGMYQPEYMQQFVIPHQYKTFEACERAGSDLISRDNGVNFRVFDYAPILPGERKYTGQAGVNKDCIPILVD